MWARTTVPGRKGGPARRGLLPGFSPAPCSGIEHPSFSSASFRKRARESRLAEAQPSASMAESPHLPLSCCGQRPTGFGLSARTALDRRRVSTHCLADRKLRRSRSCDAHATAGMAPGRIDGPNAASSARLTTGRQPAPAAVRAQPGGRSRARGTIGSCSSSAAEFSSLALAEASEVQSAATRAWRVARLAQWRLRWLVCSRDDRAWDISGAKWQSPVAPPARDDADGGGLVSAARRRFGSGYAH